MKRVGVKALAAVAAAVVVFLGFGGSAANAATPAWKLTLQAVPTVLPTGVVNGSCCGEIPEYKATAVNIGSAPTSGEVTLSDTLPAGVRPVSGRSFIPNSVLQDAPCAISGQTVTCPRSESIVASNILQVFIQVEVEPGVEGPIFNEASISGGGGLEATAWTSNDVGSGKPAFSFLPGSGGLGMVAADEAGTAATQAGSHPAQLSVDLGFPIELRRAHAPLVDPQFEGISVAGGHLKSAITTLPRGYVLNPTAVPVLCAESELESKEECPAASAVGVAYTTTSLAGSAISSVGSPIYSMYPPAGAPAAFGTNAIGGGIYVHVIGRLNAEGEYELAAVANDILARELNPVMAVQFNFWGNPSAPVFDSMRATCQKDSNVRSCPVERSAQTLLTQPGHCGQQPMFTATVSSWEAPNTKITKSVPTENAVGEPVGVDGCNKLQFEPTITAQPTTNLSDSPTGFNVTVHQPQNETVGTLSPAAMKDATVTLPDGLVVNSAAGNGLSACSESEMGYLAGRSGIHFSEEPQTCPSSAKIGRLEVSTPLLDHKLEGSIFAAKPYDNPFGSLLGIYLALEDERSGIITKLAGHVEADPKTGQLTTTFRENPELPLEDITLRFFDGPGAILTSPLVCGEHTTTSTFTPWSTPEGVDAHPQSSFQTSVPASGSTCPSSEAAAPAPPAFSAGTLTPQAGAYSPFSLRIARRDGTQRISGINTVLPKGLLGRVAGVPYCSEADIAVARSREQPEKGRLEQSSPSCPAASEIGSVQVTAGSGITPVPVDGHAYLAGPYKGAPLSLAIIAPAVAGPFDLGAVVTRVALYVDPVTAQLRAISDPLPTILQGIPLDIRSIEVKLDRNQFMLNPTSCDPSEVAATALSPAGATSPLSSRFQVGGCSGLAFKPKLAFSFYGAPTRRGGHPTLRAVVTAAEGAANIGAAAVTLPKTEFLENAHIREVCTRVQYAAQACPPRSVYGYARAWSPLLGAPLEGPVYLRSSDHKLPDLVASLNGQIHVDLDGRIDSVHRRVRNTFETVPDAPVSRFELVMYGRSKGLLVNNTQLCRANPHSHAVFTGQNGKVYESSPKVQVKGCGKKHRGKKGKKGKGTKGHKGSQGKK